MSAAAERSSRGRVILTGMLDDADLALLIKGATLAVVPSLYEGFSLPMVEAMACGVPTIASNTSCLPEISGNVLAYFDPFSVEDMAACMQKVLRDSEFVRRLQRKGNRPRTRVHLGALRATDARRPDESRAGRP